MPCHAWLLHGCWRAKLKSPCLQRSPLPRSLGPLILACPLSVSIVFRQVLPALRDRSIPALLLTGSSPSGHSSSFLNYRFFLFYFTIKFIYLFFDGFVINFSCFRPHARPWMTPFFPGSPSFHAFICVCGSLGLIMATCPSMVRRLFTGAWATVQWLHHHLPQQLLTARNPLGRGGPT